MHKFVLGVYDFMERLNTRYPHVLIEGCSGGGGRFDAGMLYYTPQIWCSDNTDAISRIKIQHGTSFGYPASTMGAHVTTAPNHQTGRTSNLITRGAVALSGTFGYELDLGKLTPEEREIVRQQISDYDKYWELVHLGRYYRLTSPGDNAEIAAWAFVADDKSAVLMNVVTLEAQCNARTYYVKPKGLDPHGVYRVEGQDVSYSGSALMHGGLPVVETRDEYQLWQVYLVRQ